MNSIGILSPSLYYYVIRCWIGIYFQFSLFIRLAYCNAIFDLDTEILVEILTDCDAVDDGSRYCYRSFTFRIQHIAGYGSARCSGRLDLPSYCLIGSGCRYNCAGQSKRYADRCRFNDCISLKIC